jgi:hypothetical protein
MLQLPQLLLLVRQFLVLSPQCDCNIVRKSKKNCYLLHAIMRLTFLLSIAICLTEDSDGVVRSQAGETYFDGSIEQDIPVTGLAEIFNCQFFIAAQCNPHIVPFFYNSKGGVGRPSRWSSGMQEDSWRGGFLLAGEFMHAYIFQRNTVLLT